MRTLKERLGPEWNEVLDPLFDSPEIVKLMNKLIKDEGNIEPSIPEVFKAFELTQPSQIKVVLIGQDPYIRGEAMGLAFSTRGNKMTPSLRIIFKELEQEYQINRRQTDLTDWANQGVFLVNTVLTTRHGLSFAHKNWGWEWFMRRVFNHIASLKQPYVVMAWGEPAKEVARNHFLDAPLVLTACHPMAEKYGSVKFTGCGHFKKVNEFLVNNNVKPIKWI